VRAGVRLPAQPTTASFQTTAGAGPLLAKGSQLEIRWHCGPRPIFPLNMAAGDLTFNGTPLYIHELEEYGMQPIISVGLSVWDGALVLAKFLESSKDFPHDFWKGKKVLELGSGTGTVGLAIALLGGNVLLTDSIEVQCLIEKNISLNMQGIQKNGGSAEVRVLNWNNGAKKYTSYDNISDDSNVENQTNNETEKDKWISQNSGKAFDFVVCSDVLFQPESIGPFVQTLVDLTTDWGRNTIVYLAHQSRYPNVDAKFQQELHSRFLVVEIPIEDHNPDFRTEKVKIFRIQSHQA